MNGTNDDDDELNSIAYDGNGALYACGYTKTSGQKSNYITMKLNLNLDTLWIRTYNFTPNQSDKAVSLRYRRIRKWYMWDRAQRFRC
jgi:hypothetical protein